MPYLYTTAEETSRDGLPIVRPLFLEFPHATSNQHPLDLDATGEFFFGPSILVAASLSPEEVAPYEVHLPPGIWYDYWTGEKLDRRGTIAARDFEIRDAANAGYKPLMVTPTLGELPVYVREGSILPIAPLVQSTVEKPVGPLTLRVFPGDNCEGSVYQDNGETYDFRKGTYFRQHFACTISADGTVTVSLAKAEGTLHPWWTSVRIEVVGFPAATSKAISGNQTLTVSATTFGSAVTVASSRTPETVTFSVQR